MFYQCEYRNNFSFTYNLHMATSDQNPYAAPREQTKEPPKRHGASPLRRAAKRVFLSSLGVFTIALTCMWILHPDDWSSLSLFDIFAIGSVFIGQFSALIAAAVWLLVVRDERRKRAQAGSLGS
jgi:hypothetical protein